MKYTAAATFCAALALFGCSDEATRQAYEGCIADQRGLSRRSATIFCSCLRDDDNLDRRKAHPAEECAERAHLAGSSDT